MVSGTPSGVFAVVHGNILEIYKPVLAIDGGSQNLMTFPLVMIIHLNKNTTLEDIDDNCSWKHGFKLGINETSSILVQSLTPEETDDWRKTIEEGKKCTTVHYQTRPVFTQTPDDNPKMSIKSISSTTRNIAYSVSQKTKTRAQSLMLWKTPNVTSKPIIHPKFKSATLLRSRSKENLKIKENSDYTPSTRRRSRSHEDTRGSHEDITTGRCSREDIATRRRSRDDITPRSSSSSRPNPPPPRPPVTTTTATTSQTSDTVTTTSTSPRVSASLESNQIKDLEKIQETREEE